MAKTTSRAKIKLKKWDSAEHLETEEDMALYLQACFEEAGDDAAFVARAISTITRAEAIRQLARNSV
jgi:probable addiction module antidote protein